MTRKPSSKRRKRIRIALAAALCLMAVPAGLWLARKPIAAHLARAYLERLGYPNAELEIRTLERDTLSLANVAIDDPRGSLQMDAATARFRLTDLLRQRRLQSLEVDGLKLELRLDALLASTDAPSNPSDAAPTSVDEALALLDLQPLFPPPVDDATLRNARLTLHYRERSLPLELNLSASRPLPNALALTLSVKDGDNALGIDATLAPEGIQRLDLDLDLPQPLETLARFRPDWRDALPADTDLALNRLRLSAELDNAQPTPALPIAIDVAGVDFRYETLEAQLPHARLSARIERFDRAESDLSLQIASLQREEFSLAPNQSLDATLAYRDQRLSLDLARPLQWDYDLGFVAGASRLAATYRLDSAASAQPISGLIETTSLSVSDFPLQPVRIDFNGAPEALAFQTSALAFADHPAAWAQPGDGALAIPPADDQPIVLTFQSVLVPPLARFGLEGVDLSNFDLSLTAKVFETSTETTAQLAARTAKPLLRLDADHTLDADLTLDLSLVGDDATETYHGSAKLSVSNAALHFPQLSADGLQTSLVLNGKELSSELPEAPAARLRYLAERVDGVLDWQANEIRHPAATAQWSGGSLSWKPLEDQPGLALSHWASVGILKTNAIRLDQVALEQNLSGGWDRLSGASELQALLDGVTLALDAQHQLDRPLDAPALSGSFQLAPAAFEHSDLLSRHLPELSGASFSGQLSARGDFVADRVSADASLEASFADGALSYPPSKIQARGVSLDLHLDSLRSLHSGETASRLVAESIDAGDLQTRQASVTFRLEQGTALAIEQAELSIFDGFASLPPTRVPIDGSDFSGQIDFQRLSLAQVSQYVDFFDGDMQGVVSGEIPFAFQDGAFELRRGSLALPSGEIASLRFDSKGLLTDDDSAGPEQAPSFADRLLAFLGIEPEKVAEQALGNLTIDSFEAILFSEQTPDTPLRIRISGTGHAENADIPVAIEADVHGSVTELYNFLIRLNSM